MRIAFILPGNDNRPTGGYSVVFEYATRLAALGNQITLIFPAIRGLGSFRRRVLAGGVQLVWPFLRARQLGRAIDWFDLPPEIARSRPLRLRRRSLRDFDTVVATAWSTAEDLGSVLPRGVGGAYFIQSHEHWSGPAERVDATWRLPLKRIVIAQWLVELADELHALPVLHIPNAVDVDFFHPSEGERPLSVLMLWHRDTVKGSDVGLAAIEAAHAALPLTATFFGVFPRPDELPAWIGYVQSPTRTELGDLYRTAIAFLSPSRLEGWALPPAEAMASGCALVATDIGGHRDYAIAEQTALLAPSEDVTALSEALVRVLTDEQLRETIAGNGRRFLEDNFTWESSTRLLADALADASATAGGHA